MSRLEGQIVVLNCEQIRGQIVVVSCEQIRGSDSGGEL